MHIDKLLNTPEGGVLANFTRVESFGARNTHWVSATIDPRNPNVFTFETRVVSENIDGVAGLLTRGPGPESHLVQCQDDCRSAPFSA